MTIQITTTDGTPIPVNFLQFPGGERHVQLGEIALGNALDRVKRPVNIRANMQSSNDVIDYLLLESVLFTSGLSVNLEVPYFPYARQDRACATGQAFSLDIMTRLLNINSHLNRADASASLQQNITVWDCHSQKTIDLLKQNTYFSNVINISPAEIIQQSPELVNIITAENSVLICPDHGAVARTTLIATHFKNTEYGQPPIICCEKQRNPLTGKIINARVNATDLTGLTAVITDDICDGGATFIGIAQELRKLNCQRIVLYVTHGIFSRGLDVFAGLIDQIFTTASLPQQPSDLLTVIAFSASSQPTYNHSK